MGPILLLDKSALQSFSLTEIGFLEKHYNVVIPPVLIFEILGDLSKYEGKEKEFSKIAQKLFSGDSKINANHRVLCLASLCGEHVSMEGVPVVTDGVHLRTSTGEKGIFYEEPIERKLIREWQRGNFSLIDRVISRTWRKITTTFDLENYKKIFRAANKDIPKALNLTEVAVQAQQISMDPEAQDFYLDFILNEYNVPLKERLHILARWHRRESFYLCDFAPYAYYCLQVFLIFHFGLANHLVSTRSTNPIDLEYLYYLPFCMAFVSGDTLQTEVSAVLLKSKQEVVDAKILKTDLRRISDEWQGITDEQHSERAQEYGCYPFPHDGSITCKLWAKHMKPWKPKSGNIKLSKEQEKRLMDQLKPMFDAIKTYEKYKEKSND